MPGTDENLILDVAIAELKRERNRLRDLIENQKRLQELIRIDEKEPTTDKTNIIQGILSSPLSDVSIKLEEVEDARKSANLRLAWKGVVELRRYLLPRLSNELLSVLGGLH